MPDLLRWQPDDIVPGLLRHGGGSPGNCSAMAGSTTTLRGGSACPDGSVLALWRRAHASSSAGRCNASVDSHAAWRN
ncbi:hypothetical protein KHF85_17910 [Xanthomonas translucens pv. graminis]|uniref:hypothetical protein n=1 Tax=Xanthomonas graminis TaxID=3390026 RepID=UPI00253FEC13|nr:hypothetical protein [Xanthomonas translucens]WIH04623.1 hypothetical protein KHF85_17910 [Xanthomonas translucens pv. graminis]